MAIKLHSVKIRKEIDEYPDMSYLGEYTNDITDDDLIIDRKEEGDWIHGEFRYFLASNNYTEDTKEDCEKYMRQDYARMEAYNNDEYSMIGIIAEVTILVQQGENCWIRQTLSSGGLWGIESDSDDSYFREVASEEIASLVSIMKEMKLEPLADEIMDNLDDILDSMDEKEGYLFE